VSDLTLTLQPNGVAASDPFGDDPAPPAAIKKERKRRMAPGEAAGTRAEHDTYDTDPALATACVEWLRAEGAVVWGGHGPLILEPTAGKGPFIVGARKVFPSAKIAATDLRPDCRDFCIAAGADAFAAGDALTTPPAMIAKADLIVSNPPFKNADELAQYFLSHMKDGATLAFLLAVTFIAASERWVLIGDPKKPPGIYSRFPLRFMTPIIPRPTFTDTSPKFEAGLFAWTKGYQGTYTGGSGPVRWIAPKRTRKPRKDKTP
jgi:hypothetical protein